LALSLRFLLAYLHNPGLVAICNIWPRNGVGLLW